MGDDQQHVDLTRGEILEALEAVSEELAKIDMIGEACLFGGAVMVLAFNARLSTRDVDAIFQPPNIIRKIVSQLAEQRGWKSDWMNDGVKGFVSEHGQHTSANLPQFPNLRLVMPTAEYLLAMKCMAARAGGIDEKSDIPDILFLIRKLSLSTAKQVLDIVTKYYGARPIPVKTQYLIEGLFQEGKV
jgi:hypothetical protein